MKRRRHERYACGIIRELGPDRWQAERTHGGETKRRNFDNRGDCCAWLESEQIALSQHDTPLGLRQTIDYNDARALLPPGVLMIDAARFYAAHHQTSPQAHATIDEVYRRFMEEKEAAGLRDRTLTKLRSNVGRLVHSMEGREFSMIATTDLQAWFGGKRMSGATRDTLHRDWSNLWTFGVGIGAASRNVVDGLVAPKWDSPAPVIWSPDQVRAFLAKCPRPQKAFYAVAFLAGLRTSELYGLEWADIGAHHITVRPAVAKRRRQRLVPVCASLAKILRPLRRDGYLAPLRERAMIRHREDILTAAKVGQWPHNVARHSWISYRLAIVQSAAQVAMEAGNSQAMIFEHYRELVTPAQARAYFRQG